LLKVSDELKEKYLQTQVTGNKKMKSDLSKGIVSTNKNSLLIK